MKTLLLLRHAKSSWDEPGVSDHDRPLNDRGKRDAPRVGEVLRERGLQPDVVLSSTAKRARKTARKALDASGFDTELELVPELYLAPPDAYLRRLRSLPESCRCVLAVGHNPGLEELLEALTGETSQFPTAGIAQLELDISSWSDLNSSTTAKLVWSWKPKD